jgi:hypothetical protein
VARPSTYRTETIDAVLRALESGCTRRAAAQTAGIAYRTLSRHAASSADLSSAMIRAESTYRARRIKELATKLCAA